MSIQNVEMFEAVMMLLFVICVLFFSYLLCKSDRVRFVEEYKFAKNVMDSIHTNISKACTKVRDLHMYSELGLYYNFVIKMNSVL